MNTLNIGQKTGLLNTQNVPSSITNALANAPKLQLSTQTPHTPVQTISTPVEPVAKTETLDPKAVNLSKAIRQVETGNQVKAGATGELPSRYQFMPDTWKGYAGEVLGDQNAPMTLENENKVAYTKIKQWKDEGLNVGQIASKWNSGSPDNYNNDHRGYNNGVYYDTPAYAQKVATVYHQLEQESANQYNPKPFSSGAVPTTNTFTSSAITTTPEDTNSLGYQLGQRGKDIGETIKTAAQGDVDPISGAIQIIGSVAGGLNDLTNKGLELIPGVKAIEGVIGDGFQSFFKTEVGQSVANEMKSFQQEHPQLSKTLGGAFNIATALPILKGIGEVKNVALDTVANKLQGAMADKVATTFENTALSGARKSASELVKKNPTVYKDLVTERVIPDVEGDIIIKPNIPDVVDVGKGTNVWETSHNTSQTWDNINNLNEKIKDRVAGGLESRQTGGNQMLKISNPDEVVSNTLGQMPTAGVEASQIVDAAKSIDFTHRTIWDKFFSGNATLDEVNSLRSSLGQAERKVFGANNLELTEKKLIAKNLYFALSDYVKKEAPDTAHLFDEMSKQFDFQKALKLIDGKPVKSGVLGTAIKTGAIGAGEALGTATGVPLAGAYGAYGAGKLAAKKLGGGLSQAVLKRSAANLTNTSTIKKGIGGLLGAALAAKAQSKLNTK